MKSKVFSSLFAAVVCAALISTGAVSDTPPAPIPCAAAPSGMACIPGGPFLRGSNDGPPHARPQQTVWVQTFFMDKNEVTYAEFKACIKAGKCKKAGPNYKDFNNPKQPINGISWYDAVNYCKVQGKHLPTEAQWEKAARGTDGRKYPWGNEEANCDRMVYMNEKGRSCGIPQKSKHPEKGRPEVIGSRPPGIYGLYDMAGNSWEWVYDWYSKNYKICGEDCAGPDPRGPCRGAEKCNVVRRRVVRGGSWYWPAEYATTYYRRSHVPSNSPFHHFGFRCAASVEEAKALISSK
jgi:formylglycine-generating enzyme